MGVLRRWRRRCWPNLHWAFQTGPCRPYAKVRSRNRCLPCASRKTESAQPANSDSWRTPLLPSTDRKPAAREMGWQTRAVATECCDQPAIAVVATYQIGQLTSQTKAEVSSGSALSCRRYHFARYPSTSTEAPEQGSHFCGHSNSSLWDFLPIIDSIRKTRE